MPGWHNGPASTSTTPPPTPPGSTRWSAAIASRAFGYGIITQRAIRRGSFSSVLAAGFRAAVGADRQDRAVRGGPTTRPRRRSNGSPRRIQSSRSTSDFARKSPGQDTKVFHIYRPEPRHQQSFEDHGMSWRTTTHYGSAVDSAPQPSVRDKAMAAFTPVHAGSMVVQPLTRSLARVWVLCQLRQLPPSTPPAQMRRPGFGRVVQGKPGFHMFSFHDTI